MKKYAFALVGCLFLSGCFLSTDGLIDNTVVIKRKSNSLILKTAPDLNSVLAESCSGPYVLGLRSKTEDNLAPVIKKEKSSEDKESSDSEKPENSSEPEVKSTANFKISIHSDSDIKVYSDADCSSSEDSLVFPADATSLSFYIKNNKEDSSTLSLDTENLGSLKIKIKTLFRVVSQVTINSYIKGPLNRIFPVVTRNCLGPWKIITVANDGAAIDSTVNLSTDLVSVQSLSSVGNQPSKDMIAPLRQTSVNFYSTSQCLNEIGSVKTTFDRELQQSVGYFYIKTETATPTKQEQVKVTASYSSEGSDEDLAQDKVEETNKDQTVSDSIGLLITPGEML